MTIYFDNAATTPLDPSINEYIFELNQKIFANPSSLHASGRKASRLLKEARQIVANHIDAKNENIIFTSGASEANNFIAKAAHFDLIITTPFEHSCMLEAIKSTNIKTIWLDLSQEGFVNLAQIEELLKEHNSKTILLSIMHGNNEIGTIQDLEKISSICKKYPKVFFHSDCVQTFIKHDFKASLLDSASFASHKIHGPKGLGFLYLSDKFKNHLALSDKIPIVGGNQEFALRAGTENLISVLALARLIETQKIDKKKIFELTKKLGSACSSGKLSNEPASIMSSFVLRACRIDESRAKKAIRISLSKQNTDKEIEDSIKIIKQILARNCKAS